MSCTVGRSYIVEAGNTPYNIAQEQLGDGNRWREIKKPDGSSLTDNDASNLPVVDTPRLSRYEDSFFTGTPTSLPSESITGGMPYGCKSSN